MCEKLNPKLSVFQFLEQGKNQLSEFFAPLAEAGELLTCNDVQNHKTFATLFSQHTTL